MSTLRVMVGVKRVIDYAVKIRVKVSLAVAEYYRPSQKFATCRTANMDGYKSEPVRVDYVSVLLSEPSISSRATMCAVLR